MMVVIDFLCNPIKNTDCGCSKAILDPGKPVTDMNSPLNVSLNGTGISPYWYFILFMSIMVVAILVLHFLFKNKTYEICFYYYHYFKAI